MDTNFAPLIADLFLFCYERDSMATLSYNTGAEIIQTFTFSFRYLDNILDIDFLYFEGHGKSNIFT